MKKAFRLTSLLTLLLLLSAIISAAVQAVDVTGKWNMKVELNVGNGTPVFVLKQVGESITGTYMGQLGETTVIGTLKGTDIRLTFTGGEYTVVYTGIVEGNTMKGKVAIGDVAEGIFSGSKEVK